MMPMIPYPECGTIQTSLDSPCGYVPYLWLGGAKGKMYMRPPTYTGSEWRATSPSRNTAYSIWWSWNWGGVKVAVCGNVCGGDITS